MSESFIRAAAVTPECREGDPKRNAGTAAVLLCALEDTSVAVLPELYISGCLLGDLFSRPSLLDECEDALGDLLRLTSEKDMLIACGLPVRYKSGLFNAAAVLFRGEILGVVPKSRAAEGFASGLGISGTITLYGKEAHFGTDLLFDADGLIFGVEVGDIADCPLSQAENICLSGASVILNPSLVSAGAGKRAWLRDMLRMRSKSLNAVYICASAGSVGSRSVYSGLRFICENGVILAESAPGEWNGTVISDIDPELLAYERYKNGFTPSEEARVVNLSLERPALRLCREYQRMPFVPENPEILEERIEEVFGICARAVSDRSSMLGGVPVVLNISGGVDSTVALLSCVRAGVRVIALTLPGPGTSERTLGNARALCSALGAELREISIQAALEQHLADIGHDGRRDVVYENAQARERTQIAMDIANMENGFMLGTGDLSESALGFTTFGGDHLSMFNPNSSLPKTLMREMIRYEAKRLGGSAHEILMDIVKTPISPELLPADNGGTQKTEDIVGDYLLIDFYLYWFIRHGYSREKLLRAAKKAFSGTYCDKVLEETLDGFLRRFKASQFKRRCSPDGVNVGSVSLSPFEFMVQGDLDRLI